MEKAAAAGKAGVRWESAALIALACATAPAWSQDGGGLPAEVLLAEARVEPQVRMKVEASTLPRLEAQDSGFQAPRVDVSVFPSSRSTGFGAVLGLSTPRASGPGLQAPAPGSVDLGLRWTHRLLGQQQIDVTAWRRMNSEHDAYTMTVLRDPTVYGARVELNLTPARKMGLGADRGFLGLHLQSGARISIKRKYGGPMVYYRTSF
jgi:hypothetical protein